MKGPLRRGGATFRLRTRNTEPNFVGRACQICFGFRFLSCACACGLPRNGDIENCDDAYNVRSRWSRCCSDRSTTQKKTQEWRRQAFLWQAPSPLLLLFGFTRSQRPRCAPYSVRRCRRGKGSRCSAPQPWLQLAWWLV